jgi:hypothetical protein
MRTGAILAALLGCGRIGFAPVAGDGLVDTPAGTPGATFDAMSSGSGDSATSVGWTHTIRSPSMLFVFVATRSGQSMAPPTVTSAAYGVMPLSKLVQYCPTCGPSGINNLELWYTPSPPVGTANIVVNLAFAADGVTGMATSYTGITAQLIDQTPMDAATTAGPTLTWTPAADARWAIAGFMDQGGLVHALLPASDQVMRSDTVCDAQDYTAISASDQLVLHGGPIAFSWTYASGTYGNGNFCGQQDSPHSWIAIGASLR